MRLLVYSVRLRLPHLLLGLLSLCGLPLSAAEPLTAPGPAIVHGENAADWQALFSALAGKGAVQSQLTERRWFRVRRKPVELTAEMRLTPDRGLSLRYNDGRTVIIDAQGVLLRDARGRNRVVPADDRAPAISTWLLPVLRFDLAALEKSFRLHGARAGSGWRLDFVPRETPATETDAVGGIVVHGENKTITRIELRPKEDLRVEIVIGDSQTGVTFSADDVQRFFR